MDSGFDRRCIFCGGTKLSKEHVYPRWLHPHLPKSGMLNHTALWESVKVAGNTRHVKTRSGEPHQGTLRVVCEECNNGWMSQLQEATKPILLPLVTGEETLLFRKQMQILSAWVSMFSMVVEWTYKRISFVTSTPAERNKFMSDRIAPRGMSIWIGYMKPDPSHQQFYRITIPIAESDDKKHLLGVAEDGDPIPNTQSTTFLVGHLFVHVFATPYADIRKRQTIPSKKVGQIWPIQKTPARFAPSAELTPAEADGIRHALTERAERITLRKRLFS